jgi:hypothetical protein
MNFDTVKATVSNVSVSTSGCNTFQTGGAVAEMFRSIFRTSVDIESMNRVMYITMHWHVQSVLGLIIVLEIFFGFWCSHKVPNDAFYVLFKFPCVAQSVPHSTTLYPIFCSHIYPHKLNSLTNERLFWGYSFFGNAHIVNIFPVYSQLKEAHEIKIIIIKAHFELVPTTNWYH